MTESTVFRRLASVAAFVLLLSGCNEVVEPEAPAILLLRSGELTTGELQGPGDTLLYRLDAPTGHPLRLFFRAETDSLVAELIEDAPPGRVAALLSSTGADTSLTGPRNGTRWFQLSESESYHVRVRGFEPGHRGGFTLLLYVQESEPEQTPARVSIGDTIAGEFIDPPGDVDDFLFRGDGGQELITFLQPLGPDGGATLLLTVYDSATDQQVAWDVIAYPSESLESHSTGRFVLPDTATYRLRVRGRVWDVDRGPYRFQLYPVDRRPEAVGSTPAVGEVVSGEAIEAVGDVDEFTVAASGGQEVNLMFRRLSGEGDPIRLELLRPDGLSIKSVEAAAPSAPDELGTGRFFLPEDEHTIRIAGPAAGSPAAGTGAYTFELYPIDPAPETVPASISIGDTIAGESLDRPGDVDSFTFTGTRGQLLNVFLTTEPTDPPASFRLELLTPEHNYPAEVPWGPDDVRTASTGRVLLTKTTEYGIRVQGPGTGSMDRGPYGFELYLIDPAPETLPSAVAIGDSVRGEQIDRAGDVDRFTFDGQQGQEINLFVWEEPGATEPFEFRVASPTGEVPDPWSVRTGEHSTWRMGLGITGEYTVEVTGGSDRTTTGPYGFHLFEIDRAPEQVPAALAIGDTIQGESIEPVGDVDEYTFEAGPADTLSLHFTVEMTTVNLKVSDLTTDELLGGTTAVDLAPPYSGRLDFPTPSAGTYRIIVDTAPWHGEAANQGPYMLALLRRE